MPRPTRLRDFVAPSRSRNSLSFIVSAPAVLRLVHDADEMLHLRNHAANGGSVLQRRATMHLVKAQADQRRALLGRAADWAADLLDRQRLALFLGHDRKSLPYSSAVAAAPRRACR